METILEKLFALQEQAGLKARIVSVQHLADLKDELEANHQQGLFAEEFYRERMQFYKFYPPDDLPEASAILMVAVPRPQTPLKFSLNGKAVSIVLPPTYSCYAKTTHAIGEQLNGVLNPAGFQVVPALLPLKLLAAHCGLVKYGRNNIGYMAGWGSFFQLAAYFTDLPCQEDAWQESHMVERCKSCRACQKICPTGAITPDRFLLHAERCLVFHNERAGSYSYPAWIDPAMHNSLMGCMLCQRICPENKPYLGWFEECVQFSSSETDLLMKGTPVDKLPEETVKKLEYLELINDLDKLPRNLGVFFR